MASVLHNGFLDEDNALVMLHNPRHYERLTDTKIDEAERRRTSQQDHTKRHFDMRARQSSTWEVVPVIHVILEEIQEKSVESYQDIPGSGEVQYSKTLTPPTVQFCSGRRPPDLRDQRRKGHTREKPSRRRKAWSPQLLFSVIQMKDCCIEL
ncbi:unnamed protein product [Cyprideis torosa]|uniref:Uncharacterized protein n=1 Tax=Cyprideis torosa TaxID=163714 RepID=A0A7R8WBC4_9CRUS|nr:unnamed protein product [Cyprideis torosa]CAG0891997.1 unnamed protein product [Cyprideis torosa]